MANINIRIDDKLKSDAEAILSEVGLNMSTAITIFAKAIVRERGIPFELKVDPFYSIKNMEHMTRSIKHAEEGKIVQHDLIEEDNDIAIIAQCKDHY